MSKMIGQLNVVCRRQNFLGEMIHQCDKVDGRSNRFAGQQLFDPTDPSVYFWGREWPSVSSSGLWLRKHPYRVVPSRFATCASKRQRATCGLAAEGIPPPFKELFVVHGVPVKALARSGI
jgi:hypothetical protein